MTQPQHGRPAFDVVLPLLSALRGLTILEVGTTRDTTSIEGDGWSTPFLAYLASLTDSRFVSVDLDVGAIATCSSILSGLGLSAELVQADALDYLSDWSGPIDVLYLDAWDYSDGNQAHSAALHLQAFRLVEPWIADGALVMVDDVIDAETLDGKGWLLIPYLLAQGYTVIHAGYLTVLQNSLCVQVQPHSDVSVPCVS